MSIRVRNHLAEEKRVGCFTLAVFLLSCDFWCSMSLPRGAEGWSAVCDHDISWSYSLAFYIDCLAILVQED